MPHSRPAWWQTRGPSSWLWLPLGLLFKIIAASRRALYRIGIISSYRLSVPVIVVGNIAAGGSGKTPVVIWLVDALRRRGLSPGIVSRGYGGSARTPTAVYANGNYAVVGDEPILLARRAMAPLWVGHDRVAAARALLAANPAVNVIVTDDGLQHYTLQRDVEILVLDEAVLGNRFPLPAGPLREPLSRIRQATLTLAHGVLSDSLRADLDGANVMAMRLQPGRWYRLGDPSDQCEPAYLQSIRTRAVAGIGRPERFFRTLHDQGISPIEARAFPDHYPFSKDDLSLGDADALLMTEKDAIKCAHIAPRETWVLPVDAVIDDAALDLIVERLHGPKAA
ncbi:MAG TPA: tetraacyldisaccharide 4'-kinase [Rhodocyclaceae bacterium]|nr:tetraacyldisaccharide 4'-kinase [Rhodocyclaceae bacterium]